MTVATRPRAARSSPPTAIRPPDLGSLQRAHHQLISAYNAVLVALLEFHRLNEVINARRRLNWIDRRLGVGSFDPVLFVLQPLIRFFAETHIKRKLAEVERLYVYLDQAAFAAACDDRYVAWAKKARELVGDLEATLTFRRKVARTLISARSLVLSGGLVSLLVGTAKQLNIRIDDVTTAGLAALLLTGFLLVYTLPFVWQAFRYKRRLFLSMGPQKGLHRRGVYRAEDALFRLASVPKKREFPIDSALWAGPLFIVSVAMFVAWVSGKSFWWAVGAYAVFVATVGALAVILGRRKAT